MTAAGNRPRGRPLAGLLAISIEQAVAAPMCTLRLADAGARVIKIESPAGDPARAYDSAVHGVSAYFASLNRGKESIVLDLKLPEARTLLERIVAQADVFVQNLRPGAAERMELGAAQLARRYPRLIAVDIVGYGQDTPLQAHRAYDLLVQAESGICAVTGTEDTPSKVGVSVADLATGMTVYAAVLEALMRRNATGEGAAIEIAMFDCMAEWMSVPLLHYEHEGREARRVGLSHAQIYPYGRFACRDGAVVIAVQKTEEWQRFCTGVLERSELATDPRFADNPSRLRNRAALDAIIGPILVPLPLSELMSRLDRHRIAWGRVSTLADLASHAALHRMAVDLPNGSFETVASPLHRALPRMAVPALDQHGAAIAAEFGNVGP